MIVFHKVCLRTDELFNKKNDLDCEVLNTQTVEKKYELSTKWEPLRLRRMVSHLPLGKGVGETQGQVLSSEDSSFSVRRHSSSMTVRAS